jgi:hypothetical protein
MTGCRSSGDDLKIATNGDPTTAVVDPATGAVVGGFGDRRAPAR